MTSRVRIAVAVVVVAAAALAGWKTLVAPKRAQTGTVAGQVVQAQERVIAANAAIANGEQARADLRRDSAVLAGLAKAVPPDDEVGPLFRQLDAIARANKIDFRSAKLVSGAAAAAPAVTPPAEGATEGKDDAAGGGAAPAASDGNTPVAAAVIQPPPGAVVGEAGLLTVPFSFTFDGGYRAMQRFLAAVHALAKSERGKIKVRGRLITIDGFSLGAGRDGFPKVMAVVSATAYLLPAGAATAASADTAAPAVAGAEAKP
ncbi:MAG: hypothetical protein QOI64_2392 [Solirubrobacteraceae bacterium]|nr:hypothetical protein [Solirubrobacteraceae bacterium]